MSKKQAENRHNKPTKRTSKLKKKKQQQNLMTAIMAFAVVGVIGLIAASGGFPGTSSPEVDQSRLELDETLGAVDAPVTIVEYSSYSCEACRAWHQAGIIEEILNEFTGQVNFVHRDFPVISPAYDVMSANVAQCALDQDENLFWALYDGLYTYLDSRSSEEDILRLGERVGLDYDALKACADNDTHLKTVEYDRQRGYDLGLRGAPAFLVNGERLFNPSPDTLRTAVINAINS